MADIDNKVNKNDDKNLSQDMQNHSSCRRKTTEKSTNLSASIIVDQNQNDTNSTSQRQRRLMTDRLKEHMSVDEADELISICESGDINKLPIKDRLMTYFKCNFKSDVINSYKNFVQGIFPDDCNCIICDKEIPRGSKYGLCEKHMRLTPFNDGKICIRCGKPTENESVYCNQCQNNHRYFDLARSSVVYEGDCATLVAKLKFNSCKWLAKYIAVMMADTYTANVLDADVIIPTPISKERLAERGYNQSLEIAKHLSGILGLEIANNTVIKYKDNLRQSDLSGRQRHDNVKGVYRLKDRSAVKGKKVVIIDDILTTGSTASEIARQLKIAGATTVYVLVFASAKYKVTGENLSDYEIMDLLPVEVVVI